MNQVGINNCLEIENLQLSHEKWLATILGGPSCSIEYHDCDSDYHQHRHDLGPTIEPYPFIAFFCGPTTDPFLLLFSFIYLFKVSVSPILEPDPELLGPIMGLRVRPILLHAFFLLNKSS